MSIKELFTGIGILISLILAVCVIVWGIAAIPHCTQLSDGTTICARFETPWKKVIWRE